jgi:fumarate hydratase class I
MKNFEASMYDLIVETSTNLPNDVRNALLEASKAENAGTSSAMSLDTIAINNEMAEKNVSPICQDTGLPIFKIYVPLGLNHMEMKSAITNAIDKATRESKLRPNAVDSITGSNSGNNLGDGIPSISIEQWDKDYIDARLMLKGGGSENMSMQYTLPCEIDGLGAAGRDLDGIRKCILHAVYNAQGKGCSPGIIGVGIGNDRTAGFDLAKTQLLRSLSDTNTDEDLRKLEEYIMDKANTFGIGTLGFGGETTILGCKVAKNHRLPASFFVSVVYNCWAFRRLGVTISPETGDITGWIYTEERKEAPVKAASANDSSSDKVVKLIPPISEEQIRALKVGDVVSIDGMIYTGRDEIHKFLFDKPDNDCPVDLNGQVIYHCGPVMAKEGEKWVVKAGGPTTSIREEPYQGDVMKRYGLRAAIGKGGLGKKNTKSPK